LLVLKDQDNLNGMLSVLREARDRTWAAGTARVLFGRVWELPTPTSRRRRGFLSRALDRSATKILTSTFLREQEAEGVIDFAGRRFMLDYGEYAALYDDGQKWEGRSGSPLAALRPRPEPSAELLWFVEVLAHAADVVLEGTEEVRGTLCRRLRATLDLRDAERSTSGDGSLPAPLAGAPDLDAVPVDVWLDDEHVRRVRLAVPQRTDTFELWDIGAIDPDWSCLPTFRSEMP
jgi:hypothetical protein